MYTAKEFAREIKEAVDWLLSNDEGCWTLKLDSHYALCVGWSDGYDPLDPTIIHSTTQPSWGLNAGIKVWTSDDLRTDFDYINFPYLSNGGLLTESITISPDEDYVNLASWLLDEYYHVRNYEVDKTGRAIAMVASLKRL